MQAKLIPHPQTPCEALGGITVTVAPRRGACLGISFRARGNIGAIAWPGERERGEGLWQRADELWRHSCFEMFVARENGCDYHEVNAATSGQWAGYRFDAYREGMTTADDLAMIAGKWRRLRDRAEMHLLVELPPAYREVSLDVGLSAVIEGKNGSKSYWALAHSQAKPDFHDRACFALKVPAAKRT
ncbi:DOMON-like domain-containing protein [Stakelama marina]|uniref:DOMON-like domain-containing protein n=1 Tax=Stakelama marina TaxID=2826939 RepID=A0A8T4IAI4_9SPHN|nr:DOMON-like domain-containing protein [Stakelama marina]MBR0551381.1 DOMON-like domain-containing protein [Stakelama marina]